MTVPDSWPHHRRSSFVLLIGVALGMVAGCTGGSGSPDSTPTTSRPRPAPTTASQVRALAQEIPLDGNSLGPIRWRLPDLKDPALSEPVLAARRYMAVIRVLYNQETPAYWIPNMQAIGTKPVETYFARLQGLTPLPEGETMIGPSWIWIIAARMNGREKAKVTYCQDNGWRSKISLPLTERKRIGSVETVEVSLLKDFPGGPVWKVTDTRSLDTDAENKPYFKQCEAWWETHTSTEGWTLPASAATSATGSPGS